MTGFTRQRSRVNDLQDQIGRGSYGQWTAVDGLGAVMSVRGTGTLDEEVPIANLGYGFRLADNTDADVFMLSVGADVNDKIALPTIPRNMQYQWGVDQGGIQHPTNPERRIEFNSNETWLKDGSFKIGNGGEVSISVSNGAVNITLNGGADLQINGNVKINGNFEASGAVFQHNGKNVGATHRHGGVDTGPSNTGVPT
jgi:hypothetical protein